MGLFDLFRRKVEPPSKEVITQRAFAELDKQLRSASIAELGGSRPTGDPLRSRFTGDFVMLPEEEWPTSNGQLLQAFLQINVSELPYVPAQLKGFQIVTIFIDEENVPYDQQPSGAGWVLRAYTSTDGLAPRKNPIAGSPLKAFEVSWTKSESEAPNWEDAWSIADLSKFNELENSGSIFYERYNNQHSTKVGGWPSLIPSELRMGPNNFVLQIDSEEKVGWSYLDAGTMYVGRVDGVWVLEGQCY